MFFPFVLVIVGIALLYFGGEVLVDNSIRLARRFGVSSLVIGLTVVAFATSSPELAATLTAAFRGVPDIAVGNVLGSNVANLGLILGSAALIYPLTVSKRFIRREVAFMVFVTILVYPLMITSLYLDRFEGLLLVVMLGLFIATQIREKGTERESAEQVASGRPLWLLIAGVVLGIALLVAGAQALVAGASDVARGFGVPERVIGLTLVALGTSLPELAASVVAARRREADLVLGNVIGSNIFNLLCIFGITSLVHPISVAPAAVSLDFWVMLGVSLLVMIMLATRRKLVRIEGLVLLLIYAGYTVFLYRA